MNIFNGLLYCNQMELNKRVLNFDINGTIIAHDSTDTIPLTAQANERISKSKMGNVIIENEEFKWISCMEKLTKVSIESLTYHNFVKKYYKDSYEKLSRTFTDKDNVGEKYRTQYLAILKHIMNTKVFVSFTNVLNRLNKTDCVILRTFGEDGPHVVEKISSLTTKYFIFGQLYYDKDLIELHVDNNIYSGYDSIEKYLQTCPHHLCIKDDYDRWKNNKKKTDFGKPMFCSDKYSSLFFDDNPCVYGVNIDPNNNCTNNYICIVNTLDALFDSNYFTKKLEEIKI